jgi:hypothetical protein
MFMFCVAGLRVSGLCVSGLAVSGLAVAGGLLVAGAAAAEPRAVIELFTSQGCSSCPAADKLISELSKDPAVVVLSLPIDYWDYLGWKDTLASPGHTARQKAYSHMRGDREVYTPQVVVNGVAQAIGSEKGAIDRAVAQSRKTTLALSAPNAVSVADGNITVMADAKAGDHGSGDVWLCGVTRAVQVPIGRGENKGKTITYTNVVRRWVKLGRWSGDAERWSVPLSDLKAMEADEVVVMIQGGSSEKPGVILGAAVAALP